MRGLNALLATLTIAAGAPVIVAQRLRKGSANTARGALRFVEELVARVTRAGASGTKLLRADSGFWNTKVFERLEKAGWQYSIGVRMIKTVRAAVEAIDEDVATARPMQRLLMGEVGSGKTVCALHAMLRAVENGAQAALMAPTETLAEQHHRTLDSLLGGQLPLELLTGSTQKQCTARQPSRKAGHSN